MNKTKTKMTDLLGLLVFAVFSLCMLALLLTGVKAYENMVHKGRESYDRRTAAQYLSTRVRQGGWVEVEDFDGCQALVTREEVDGTVYLTRIYCYDGYIRELFAAESTQVHPDDGEILLAAGDLDFSVDDEILTVEITHPDGEVQQLFFWLPKWKEAAP